MNEGIEVVEAEMLPPAPPPPAKDPVTGAFLPGHSIGRPKGSKGAISRKVRDEFLEEMERRGPASNPLICLLDLGTDPTIKPEVRSASLARLCSFILPKPENKFGGDTINISAHQVAVMDQVRNNPGMRGFMERAARQLAAARTATGDSHILPVPPEHRAGDR